MKTPFSVPREIASRQGIAADPRNSVWVSANAGSGKTHVLSRRVIRLLLQGTDPSKILCLTYTRAAAANMARRVYDDLAGWTVRADADLAADIEKLEGQRPGPERLRRARRLFAEALETPGGLKIQTIHAFCEAILHQFPLEANIAGHFEMLDQQMERSLIAEASRAMITGAAVSENPALAAAFASILDRSGESGLEALLGEIVAKRDGLRLFVAQLEQQHGKFPALFAEFGFDPGETAETIAASVWPLPGFDRDYFNEFASAAEDVHARTIVEKILPDARRAFAEADPQRRLALLAAGFLTVEGEPYAAKSFKQALRHRVPDLLERYGSATAAIIAAADRLALFRMLEATSAALVVADWLIARYERMKAARGFLDFNDLITRTARLLSRADVGPWVQYKLDQGIDHILIDEAQDTSPDQWNVVRRLAEDFFSGLGARDGVHRTVFAVGDEKQSIYSFQGADPRLFADSGRFFDKRVRAAKGRFETVKLNWSFRSTDDILAAVDRVFAGAGARKGLTRDPEPIEHKAIRAGAPGYVEIWPSIGATAVEEPDDWRESVDHATAPAVQLADAIARTIAGWIGKPDIIEGKSRALGAGDVLVLVRKRDRFIHALSRSLKVLGIAVAGADRLSLSGHIAVKDLVALGRVVLQPHDDLSLAALLRSPIFGLSEDALFDVAHGRRPAVSLDQALRAQGAGRPGAGRDRRATRAMAQRGCLQAGVRLLCRRARPRRRQAPAGRPSRTGSRRHHRRVPELLPRPGKDRHAGARSLPGDARKCRPRGQARDGSGPRRGPHHDGACRKGPGGAGRLPGRQWQQAVQRAASAAPAAVRIGARPVAGHRLSLARLGNCGERQFARRRGADQGGGRGGVPPLAVCRHDARRRPPHRLRLSRPAAAGRRHMACAGERGTGRRPGGRSAAGCRSGQAAPSLSRHRPAGPGHAGSGNAAGEGRGETCHPTGCVSPCRPNRRCRGR